MNMIIRCRKLNADVSAGLLNLRKLIVLCTVISSIWKPVHLIVSDQELNDQQVKAVVTLKGRPSDTIDRIAFREPSRMFKDETQNIKSREPRAV